MSETSIPTELYSLVFRFLVDAGLVKTSETFKKEYKSIKDLKQKYDLVEIFKSYKSLVNGKNIEEEADSDSSSSSSSGSSIEDSTDDESSSSDKETFDEKVKNDYNKIEDNSSSSSEDSDSSEEEVVMNNQDNTEKAKESKSSDPASLDSSEESENEQNVTTNHKVKEESDSSDESSDESESSSSEKSKISNAADTQDNMKNNGQISSSSIKSENGENGGIKDKSSIKNNSKRKLMDETSSELVKLETVNHNCSPHEINEKNISSNGLKHNLDTCDEAISPSKKLNSSALSTMPIPYFTTTIHFKPLSVQKNQRKINKTNQLGNKSNNNGSTNNRRINPDEVEFLDERLKDNSFLAKGGAVGSYGYKAHNDLIVTRGKDFRAQKTKKKRGSYRGGKIDLESHSIKFDEED
ncbi:5321_t:CDS:2 [Funneliformis caledonium]|uniref:5321_t:CDS:1 n=1 Tax=Funneliformis caledonium TaxID=1117310 RepID=A0A9N9CK54_9GLOM|nr:5321_t:CDS:2 [Funneliformis caledonium]